MIEFRKGREAVNMARGKKKHIGDVTIPPKNSIGNTGPSTNPTPKSK